MNELRSLGVELTPEPTVKDAINTPVTFSYRDLTGTLCISETKKIAHIVRVNADVKSALQLDDFHDLLERWADQKSYTLYVTRIEDVKEKAYYLDRSYNVYPASPDCVSRSPRHE